MLANVIRLRREGEESVVAIDSTNVPLIPKFKSVQIVAKLIED
jgi:hypothetical protein